MRVIAGIAKGRRLKTAAGQAVRPTSDKVRGAIFSILGSRFDLQGAHVLDLFAGSGALGIEALSRGAEHATFVDEAATSIALIESNLATCGFSGASRVLRAPVSGALKRLTQQGADFDGVLIDPPYREGEVATTLQVIVADKLIRAHGWIVIEHHVDEPPPENLAGLQALKTSRYGKTAVTLLIPDLASAT